MKFSKRFATILAAAALAVSATIPVMAAIEDTGFVDIAADAWYAAAVEYCYDNNLMSGLSDTEFGPNTPVLRAMITSALNNQENLNENTDELVTREQAAVILWQNEGSPNINSALEPFADQETIASDAAEAVEWARENEIIIGKGNNWFDPKALITRAEAAVIIQNYLNNTTMTQENNMEAMNNEKDNDSPVAEETNIMITVGDTVIPAVLNDSVSAQALIETMPFTVSMTRGSADFYASMEEPLEYSQEDVHNGWQNGDIGFDSSGNYLTIFHSGEDTSENIGNQVTLGHVSDLSLLGSLGASIQANFALADTQSDTDTDSEHNALVVYYSHTQRTQRIATLLSEKVNGDIFEIVPQEPYTGTDSEISTRASEEMESRNFPDLSGQLPDLSQYNIIFIGGPVWSDTVASPVFSYLADNDFVGKTVAPFSTDQGTHRNYESDFTTAVNNAQEIISLLPISHVSSMSDEDINTLLDAWLETVYE